MWRGPEDVWLACERYLATCQAPYAIEHGAGGAVYEGGPEDNKAVAKRERISAGTQDGTS